MEEQVLRWGITLESTGGGAFLLGANINIDVKEWHCYLCIYLGFRTLVIGRDWFPIKGKQKKEDSYES